jgi:AhpD family alkylhydroperoxidase
MARISLDPPKTLAYRIATRFTRRRYGQMLDPAAAMGHNMQVARSYALFELQVERWHSLDTGLKDLAVLAAAAGIGCGWCLDFGYWEATMRHHVPAEKIRAVPGWRDSASSHTGPASTSRPAGRDSRWTPASGARSPSGSWTPRSAATSTGC